ncbi:hypothetical protein MC7420_2489 [Coleofasciculus chthonoplastes PCC 7420]|jgi:hypothetical protein|uniref:Uncharacterized protein n=1 Tax=Coleofasciculus chthonoplastes PCC 7420 TaxID=118168 RepID=B4VZL0_9CYAN|nr:hypothetical protein MC7420_2489 [Coleofasciculus chthonoplastes PCC 7420]
MGLWGMGKFTPVNNLLDRLGEHQEPHFFYPEDRIYPPTPSPLPDCLFGHVL